tara:strand:+ start:36 stop:182 length:147 start_codon:yes stop_codon:yes gene_type:complete
MDVDVYVMNKVDFLEKQLKTKLEEKLKEKILLENEIKKIEKKLSEMFN